MTARWITHAAARMLPFVLLIGVAITVVRTRGHILAGYWLPVVDHLPAAFGLALGLCVLLLLGSLLFRGLARSLGLAEGPATALGTAAALAPIFSVAGYEINRHLLPGITETVSIVGNLVLVLAMGLVWSRFGRGLSRFLAAPPDAMPSPARFWPLLPTAAVPLVLAALWARVPDTPVLFILIDTLRADRLGCYGNERAPSPVLDRLAADGILFADVVAPATATKSSVASLFTGKDPWQHGVYRGNLETPDGIVTDRISEDETTIAERFHAAGYRTIAFVHNKHVSKQSRYDQGFMAFTEQAGSVRVIYDRFARWFEREKQYPFFAYLHIIDVHAPYRPPEPWNLRYDPAAPSVNEVIPDDEWRSFVRATRSGEGAAPDDVLGLIRDLYDAEITVVDDMIGDVVEDLRDAGLYDRTCIVVASDHGDGFQEHGFLGHSHYPYQELTHVPLIVKLPHGDAAGTIERRTVRLRDVGDMLAQWVGIDAGGNDAAGNDAGGNDDRRVDDPDDGIILSENHISIEPGDRPIAVSARDGAWKLIRLPDGSQELYEIDADPLETTNRIDDYPEITRRLAAAIDRVARDRRYDEDIAVLPKAAVDELRALGYVGN